MVVDGHLTGIPIESVYSGVVSLHSLRMTIFLAELNKVEHWGGDVGNAYLEAKTKEKISIIAGPEFGDRQGHILIVRKPLLFWKGNTSACVDFQGEQIQLPYKWSQGECYNYNNIGSKGKVDKKH